MNTDKIDQYFNKAKSKIKFKEKSNWSIEGFRNKDIYDAYIELILNELKFEDPMNLTLRNIFQKKVEDKIRSKDRVDWNILKQEVIFTLHNSSTKLYRIGIGVPIKVNKPYLFPFKKLKLKDIEITNITFEDFDKLFNIQTLVECYLPKYERKKILMGISSFYFFKGLVQGINDRDALDKFIAVLEVIRSSINVEIGFGGYTYYLGGEHKQLQIFPEPDFYMVEPVDKSSPLEQYKTFYSDYRLNSTDILNRDFTNSVVYTQVISLLKKNEINYVEEVFLNIVRQYNLALNSKSRAEAFLNYWRILEITTNSKDRRNSEVIAIIKSFFEDEDIKLIGDLIVVIRNDYVHNGIYFEYSDANLHWIKLYSEMCILIFKLILKEKYSSSQELDTFFSLYPNKLSELRLKTKIVKSILKLKKTYS